MAKPLRYELIRSCIASRMLSGAGFYNIGSFSQPRNDKHSLSCNEGSCTKLRCFSRSITQALRPQSTSLLAISKSKYQKMFDQVLSACIAAQGTAIWGLPCLPSVLTQAAMLANQHWLTQPSITHWVRIGLLMSHTWNLRTGQCWHWATNMFK